MKKLAIFALSILLFISSIFLISCKEKHYKEATCQEVIAAYEQANYDVWHKDMEEEDEYVCVVKASRKKNADEYVYFTFFETEEEAEAYVAEHDHTLLTYLFTLIFGGEGYARMDNYGKVVVEYDDKALLKPFKILID